MCRAMLNQPNPFLSSPDLIQSSLYILNKNFIHAQSLRKMFKHQAIVESKLDKWFLFYYYFLLPRSRESIVFVLNFRNGDFEGITRFDFS